MPYPCHFCILSTLSNAQAQSVAKRGSPLQHTLVLIQSNAKKSKHLKGRKKKDFVFYTHNIEVFWTAHNEKVKTMSRKNKG